MPLFSEFHIPLGPTVFPLSAVSPTTPTFALSPTVFPITPVSVPVNPTPVVSIPVISSPVIPTPVVSTPVVSIPVISTPIFSIPVSSIPVVPMPVGPMPSVSQFPFPEIQTIVVITGSEFAWAIAAAEVFLYGAYLVLFAFYLYVLRTGGMAKHRFLNLSTISLFILCTAHCALLNIPGLCTRLDAGVAAGDVEGTAKRAAQESSLVFTTNAVYVTSKSLHSLLVAYPQLIFGRIWWLARAAQKIMGPKVAKRYRTAGAMILESGAIYGAGGLAYIIMGFVTVHSETMNYNITTSGSILGQLVGIAPTIIAVRVGLGCCVENEDSFIAATPRLRPPAQKPAMRSLQSGEERVLYICPEHGQPLRWLDAAGSARTQKDLKVATQGGEDLGAKVEQLVSRQSAILGRGETPESLYWMDYQEEQVPIPADSSSDALHYGGFAVKNTARLTIHCASLDFGTAQMCRALVIASVECNSQRTPHCTILVLDYKGTIHEETGDTPSTSVFQVVAILVTGRLSEMPDPGLSKRNLVECRQSSCPRTFILTLSSDVKTFAAVYFGVRHAAADCQLVDSYRPGLRAFSEKGRVLFPEAQPEGLKPLMSIKCNLCGMIPGHSAITAIKISFGSKA
ncbi:hypothetical protein FB451DRAFT_1485379 [Mycena latifolia]|nr:hypothetical protein FB451DRAFT_1485379 [Mycena latifolia]